MRVCSECEHAAFNSSGVYCILLSEWIWDEEVAEECGEYTPIPGVGESDIADITEETQAELIVFNGRGKDEVFARVRGSRVGEHPSLGRRKGNG